MKVKEVMNYHFSIYECGFKSSNSIGTISLYDWLYKKPLEYKGKVWYARKLYNENYEYYKKFYKPKNFLGATISGIFPSRREANAKDKTYTGFICIDVDKYEGDLEQLKKDCLLKLDYSICAIKSLSGHGISVICLYDTYYEFDHIWNGMIDDFRNKIGVEPDTSCCDVSRLRFISYDENTMIKKEECEIIPFDKIIIPKQNENVDDEFENDLEIEHIMTKESYKELTICIDKLVKAGYGSNGFSYYDSEKYNENTVYDYAKWRRDAWRLGSLDRPDIGRKLFRFISKNAEGYVNQQDADKLFNNSIRKCKTHNNVGYYFTTMERLHV